MASSLSRILFAASVNELINGRHICQSSRSSLFFIAVDTAYSRQGRGIPCKYRASGRGAVGCGPGLCDSLLEFFRLVPPLESGSVIFLTFIKACPFESFPSFSPLSWPPPPWVSSLLHWAWLQRSPSVLSSFYGSPTGLFRLLGTIFLQDPDRCHWSETSCRYLWTAKKKYTLIGQKNTVRVHVSSFDFFNL